MDSVDQLTLGDDAAFDVDDDGYPSSAGSRRPSAGSVHDLAPVDDRYSGLENLASDVQPRESDAGMSGIPGRRPREPLNAELSPFTIDSTPPRMPLMDGRTAFSHTQLNASPSPRIAPETTPNFSPA